MSSANHIRSGFVYLFVFAWALLAAVPGVAAPNRARQSAGNVWSWGDNAYGQLGDGTTASSSTPVRVINLSGGYLSGVVAVAVGGLHSLALKSDGTVWAWGYNGYGQLGDGTTMNSRSTPVQVSS